MPQLYRQATKHIFFEEMHYKHLSLHPFIVMSFNRMIIPAAIDDFCNQFWETLKISLQSTKPFLWKQLPVSHFGQTPVCWMWESLQQLCAQYTSLKIVHLQWKYWQFGIVDRPGTSLSQQYAMQSAYCTHCCWYPQYWIFRHSIF